MKPEAAYLIRLLKAFIHQQKAPSLPNDVDGDALVRLAKSAEVGGIVGYMAQPFMDAFSAGAANYLSRLFYGTVGQFAHIGVACEQLFAQLREAKIPFAVLKGAVLGHLYPMRELRTFGDIDIFVPASYRDAVQRVVAEDTVFFTDNKQVCVRRAPLNLEFHFDITTDGVESLPQLREYLEKTEQHFYTWQGQETVDPLYHFVYLLAHQMRHFTDDSPGIRSYMDLAVFLKSEIAPKADVLTPILKELGLYAYAQTALTLTELWFGVPSPLPKVTLQEQDIAFLTAYIVDAGQFGKNQNPRAVMVAKRGGKTAALWQSVFPPKDKMRENPLYANKWLPFAYMYRLYRGAFKRREYAITSLKDIHTANKDVDARYRANTLLQLGGCNSEE